MQQNVRVKNGYKRTPNLCIQCTQYASKCVLFVKIYSRMQIISLTPPGTRWNKYWFPSLRNFSILRPISVYLIIIIIHLSGYLGEPPPGTRYPPPRTRYTPPPGSGTPPQDQVPPPGTRYTPPRDQVHPPGPGTPPPRDQVHPPRYRKSTFSLQKHIFYSFFSSLYRLMSFSVLLTPI